MDYEEIALHALQRPVEMIDRSWGIHCILAPPVDMDESESSACEEEGISLRFIPRNPMALDEMYQAITDCSLLHQSNDAESEDLLPMQNDYQGFEGDNDDFDDFACASPE